MIKEFKEFISQGNVLDLAVGVIIGGAFSAIVNSLITDVFMPLIGAIVGVNFETWILLVNNSEIKVGLFINAIVNFFVIAVVLFLMLKAINSVKKKPEVVEETPVTPEDIQLLREIRDALNKQ